MYRQERWGKSFLFCVKLFIDKRDRHNSFLIDNDTDFIDNKEVGTNLCVMQNKTQNYTILLKLR